MLVMVIGENHHAKRCVWTWWSCHELYIVKRCYTDHWHIVIWCYTDHWESAGAGAIMALAFSGLFFSEKLLHQQFALLLVTSVLLDTYVVRTVLVPALMMLAGDYNWWPRKMPNARRWCHATPVGQKGKRRVRERSWTSGFFFIKIRGRFLFNTSWS